MSLNRFNPSGLNWYNYIAGLNDFESTFEINEIAGHELGGGGIPEEQTETDSFELMFSDFTDIFETEHNGELNEPYENEFSESPPAEVERGDSERDIRREKRHLTDFRDDFEDSGFSDLRDDWEDSRDSDWLGDDFDFGLYSAWLDDFDNDPVTDYPDDLDDNRDSDWRDDYDIDLSMISPDDSGNDQVTDYPDDLKEFRDSDLSNNSENIGIKDRSDYRTNQGEPDFRHELADSREHIFHTDKEIRVIINNYNPGVQPYYYHGSAFAAGQPEQTGNTETSNPAETAEQSEAEGLRKTIGPSNPNNYGYYCSFNKYPVTAGELSISFDSCFESAKCSTLLKGTDVFINENGDFKVHYGIICNHCEQCEMGILINNIEIFESKIGYVCEKGATNAVFVLNAHKDDQLSLKISGKEIMMSDVGVNAFVLIEKINTDKY